MTKTKPFGTMDIYLASFLCLHDQDVALEVRNGKVIFTFEASDSLYRFMNEFNSNVKVNVADYTVAIKTLRGKMLTAKEFISELGKRSGNDL